MKAVITKSQFDRIKNFINETKEIPKSKVLKEKELSDKQKNAFDVDNDGKPFEPEDFAALRAMKKVDKSLDEKKYSDKASSFIGKEISHLMRDKGYPHDRAVAAAINVAKEKGMKVGKKQMDEDSDCGCGEDKDDTRYMFFSNLEQMMRQARMLLQMDEDMLEDLLNNGHDWAADHIAEAKNNMDQVFDFIMGEMHGEGEDESWHNEKEMVYEAEAWASDGGYYDRPERDRLISREEADIIKRGIEKFKTNINNNRGIVVNNYSEGILNRRIINNLIKNWGVEFDYDSEEVGDVYYLVPNQNMEDVNDGLEYAHQLFYDRIIKEGIQLKKKVQTSKELKHHLNKNIPLSESIFKYGSEKHIELLKEVKELYTKGFISLNETDEFIINEFDPKPVKIKGIGEVYLGLIQEEYESDEELLSEAVYQGRKVQLGKRMAGDSKKFKVYVRNDKGNVVKVNFGQKGVKIKKNNPARRKSFRARHNCSNPGPRWKARYWSCRAW